MSDKAAPTQAVEKAAPAGVEAHASGASGGLSAEYSNMLQTMRTSMASSKNQMHKLWDHGSPAGAFITGEIYLAEKVDYGIAVGVQNCGKQLYEHPYRSALEIAAAPMAFVIDSIWSHK